MKRFLGFLVLASAVTACGLFPEDVVEQKDDISDGLFVCGEATALPDFSQEALMSVATVGPKRASRDGLMEKFMVLEGGKDFKIKLMNGETYATFSAALKDSVSAGIAPEVALTIQKGVMQMGDDAPAMQVPTTGLYHIIVDFNYPGDLGSPSIVVAPVAWGVSGVMNKGGFTAFDGVEVNAEEMSWTLENQRLSTTRNFHFCYGGGSALSLDAGGKVKVNTYLGAAMLPGGNDIVVDTIGFYTVKLMYKRAAGRVSESFSYELKRTGEVPLPSSMYMSGSRFGGEDWSSDAVVSMEPVKRTPGTFWAIRYVDTLDFVRFSTERLADKSFVQLEENSGFEVFGDSVRVAKNGNYLFYVDADGGKIVVEPARVYGHGSAFQYPEKFGVENQRVRFKDIDSLHIMRNTAPYDGELRLFMSSSSISAGWKFRQIYAVDGLLKYNLEDFLTPELEPEPIAHMQVAAGQIITLDFNAGTILVEDPPAPEPDPEPSPDPDPNPDPNPNPDPEPGA